LIAFFFLQRRNSDSLAELRSLYAQSRPTETRISEFGYAPLVQLRGAPDAGDERRRRVLVNGFINAVQESPNAQTHHALAVFYLTEQKYPEAIKEFENALKVCFRRRRDS
jgi:hypothetical protein